MTSKQLFRIILAAVLPFLASAPAQPATTGPMTASNKLTAAYYFYWYNVYTNQHFIDPDHSDALTDHPPDAYLSNFSWSETAWHRRELLDMLEAKIDIILPVYWGSNQEAYWSVPGLQKLVEAAQGLEAEGTAPPAIGMFYDTTALQQQNGGVKPDLTTTAGKALFYDMIADFFTLVPADLWAQVDGRPLIWLYTSEYAEAYNQSSFTYISQQFQNDFGVTPFIVREASWQSVVTDGVYTWGVALNGATTAGQVGSLGPGYDESAVYGRSNPRSRDRQCGEFYNDQWEALCSSSATLLGLETWNEFHEGTDIAASREYNRTYISLTAQNIARWKAADFGAATAVWVDLGRSPYSQGLRPAANTPDGAWLTKQLSGREAAYPDNTTADPSYYIYLDVNDAFWNAHSGEAWVTVEYFDGDSDGWALQYDGASQAYTPLSVALENSGQWKQKTFHLTDAFFGGRENFNADLRLSDNAWYDGKTNHFGRVWVSRTAPTDQAPDLLGLQDILLKPGQTAEITLSASDPQSGSLSLKLERAPAFASLADHGNGTATLRLAPAADEPLTCAYTLRALAAQSGSPILADAATARVRLYRYGVFLPLVLTQ